MKRSTVPSSPARQILSSLDLNLPPSPPPEPYLPIIEDVPFLSPPILTTPTKFSDQAYPSSSSQSHCSNLFDASFLSTPPSTAGYPTSPISPYDDILKALSIEKRRQRAVRPGTEVQEDAFDRGNIFFGSTWKRRKVSSRSETCQFDTGRKVQEPLPRTGRQMSTLEMNRLREIGFRVKPSHSKPVVPGLCSQAPFDLVSLQYLCDHISKSLSLTTRRKYSAATRRMESLPCLSASRSAKVSHTLRKYRPSSLD